MGLKETAQRQEHVPQACVVNLMGLVRYVGSSKLHEYVRMNYLIKSN